MLSPLLVQLFGRDVVDRLEQAGLATDDAVAQLGAEQLSAQAGIAPDIARRVAALAVELCAPSRRPRARRGGATRPRGVKSGARGKRRKGEQPAPDVPAAPSERAAAPSGPADPETDDESTEIPALQQSNREIEAFVDEAGLIAWMGFAARIGPEGSLLSSVADGILESADPSESGSPSGTASPSETASTPEQAPSQRATEAPARSSAVTLEGSFWGFGSRPHPGVTVSPSSTDTARPENTGEDSGISNSTASRPVPFHRRRSHDGH